MVKVEDQGGRKFTGRLVDISDTGIKMVTKEKILIGDSYKFEICLPEKIEDFSEIKCNGSTVWYKHHLNPDRYSAGFNIEGIDPMNQALLDKLIRTFMA